MKKYAKYLSFLILYFILVVLFITIIGYFQLVDIKVLNKLTFSFIIIGTFYTSYKIGKNSIKNGYLEGLKFGGITISILLILAIIFNEITIKSLFYYSILLIISIIGSMIGINKKETSN